MRMVVVSLALFMMLASTASSQQGGFATTPPDGPESAKLAATYDPTKATVITAADVAAAIAALPQDRVSANGTFVERQDPGGLAYRIAVDRRRTPQRANAHADCRSSAGFPQTRCARALSIGDRRGHGGIRGGPATHRSHCASRTNTGRESSRYARPSSPR